VAVSPSYDNEAVGPVAQGRFLNAVAALETELPPQALMKMLQGLEAQAGRLPEEKRQHGGPRTLDLDLLLYDDVVLNAVGLTVPHPRMHERWFVLRPLVDVEPRVMHPVLKATAEQLLAQWEAGRESRGSRTPGAEHR